MCDAIVWVGCLKFGARARKVSVKLKQCGYVVSLHLSGVHVIHTTRVLYITALLCVLVFCKKCPIIRSSCSTKYPES